MTTVDTYNAYKNKPITPYYEVRYTAVVCPFCRKPINDDTINPYCYTCGFKVRLK